MTENNANNIDGAFEMLLEPEVVQASRLRGKTKTQPGRLHHFTDIAQQEQPK